MPHVYQQPPLKASRELYEGKDPTATVYIMESSGGMVAGDRNDITVKLAPDSSARLVQQSALENLSVAYRGYLLSSQLMSSSENERVWNGCRK